MLIEVFPRSFQIDLVLYDTIDYIKVTPEQGFARTGGEMRGKQYERFEAVAPEPTGQPSIATARRFSTCASVP